jgi:hypothetical protein
MKLAVVYPWTSDFVYTDWAENVLELERPAGFEVKFIRGRGWCPARRHIDGCEKAVEWGAELICIIGADQLHPHDMLSRLISGYMEKLGGMVAALIPFRGVPHGNLIPPFGLIGWRARQNWDALNGKTPNSPTQFDPVDPTIVGLQEANAVGSGAILFDVPTLLSIKRPWFYEHIDPESYQRFADMDSTFVMRMQTEGGARLWIDATIDVKHLDIFPIDRTFSRRFADWRKEENGWSFTFAFINYIRESFQKGSTIVEFGSGSGSSVLAEDYRYVCVEHDDEFVGKYPNIQYIQAKIKNGWYDRDPVVRHLPKADCYIIDGPTTEVGREGLIENVDLLPTDKTIVFDDVNRNGDLKIARQVSATQGRELWLSKPKKHQYCDEMCRFGVVGPTNTNGLTLDDGKADEHADVQPASDGNQEPQPAAAD